MIALPTNLSLNPHYVPKRVLFASLVAVVLIVHAYIDADDTTAFVVVM